MRIQIKKHSICKILTKLYNNLKVSHHPPMVAQYCEGAAGWRCWQEFTMTSKFRGKYLQIIPLGSAYVEFDSTGNRYKWRKVIYHLYIAGRP